VGVGVAVGAIVAVGDTVGVALAGGGVGVAQPAAARSSRLMVTARDPVQDFMRA
jgi:hypothetical protein